MVETIAKTTVHKVITIPEDKGRVYNELQEFFAPNNIPFRVTLGEGRHVTVNYTPKNNPNGFFYNKTKQQEAILCAGESYILNEQGEVCRFDTLNEKFVKLDFFNM